MTTVKHLFRIQLVLAPVFSLLLLLGLFTESYAQTCSQPSNLNSNVLSSGTVALEWSEIQGATKYQVQYRVSTSNTWLNGGVVTNTNQVLSGLAPETVYSWRVKANCSSYSSIAQFNSGGGTGGNTSCSQPSNLTSEVLTPTSTKLSWSAIEGALYYTVQFRVSTSTTWTTAGSVTGTDITLNQLQEETVYSWRVKASCSVYSSVAQFNSGGGTGGNTSCSQPSNLQSTILSTTSVRLNWSAIEGALNYRVQYRASGVSSWTTSAPVNGTTLRLNNLQTNTEYFWRVKASCSTYSSITPFSTGNTGGGGGGNPSCSAPSNTNTDVVQPTSATISWEAQSEASNYTVQYRLISNTNYITVGTVTTTSTTITGLRPNREYVWRVKASCSPYGSDVQFSTPATLQGSGAINMKNEKYIQDVNVFPNPAFAETVQVEADAPNARLLIFNSLGQVVFNQNMRDNQQTVDINGWASGQYIIRIQYEDGQMETTKLVVTH